MSRTKEQNFKLKGCDAELTLSVFEGRLLFLHAPFLSSQWDLNKIGVRVEFLHDHVRVNIHPMSAGEAFQGWDFDAFELNRLIAYFKSLGFLSNPSSVFNMPVEEESKH